jgi:hypothetical protein
MSVENKINTLIEEAVAKKEEGSLKAPIALGGAALGAKLLKGAGLAKKAALMAKMAKAGSGAAYVDPSQSRLDSAKQSALYSALGTGIANTPGMLFGGIPAGAVGIASGMAAAKGGAMGAALGGGRDTLVKSSLIPAGIVAATAPLTTGAMQAAGYDTIEVDPTMSAALTGGLGGAGWLYRNWNKKKEVV